MDRLLIPATVEIPEGRIGGRIVEAFWIGRTPVTNREYAPYLAEGRAPVPPWWTDAAFASPRQPVVGVSWDEASAYCEWLSRFAGDRWRLPSEAEWEHAMSGSAARDGLPPATAWGDSIPAGEIPEGPLTAPWEAGRGTPNAFGVLDPGTVVHEWCLDWREAGPASPETASPGFLLAGGAAPLFPPRGVAPFFPPRGVAPLFPPRGAAPRRASRGGSWRHRIPWSAPSARSSLPPHFRYSDYGFRVLREIPRG